MNLGYIHNLKAVVTIKSLLRDQKGTLNDQLKMMTLPCIYNASTKCTDLKFIFLKKGPFCHKRHIYFYENWDQTVLKGPNCCHCLKRYLSYLEVCCNAKYRYFVIFIVSTPPPLIQGGGGIYKLTSMSGCGTRPTFK